MKKTFVRALVVLMALMLACGSFISCGAVTKVKVIDLALSE